MIRSGLCSIAFRDLTPAAVVRLAAEAKLDGIEWGGDVHVPPGDELNAELVGRLTREAGLAVAAYGSYYRIDGRSGAPDDFSSVLAAARALGAPLVRVWAGGEDAERTPLAQWRRIVEATRDCAEQAAKAGLTIACEWHMGTLLSTNASAQTFLDEVNHPALRTYWQPAHFQDDAYCLAGLETVRDRLAHLHVFHWWPSLHERHALSAGAPRWRRFLDEAAAAPGDRFALLELLAEATPECLQADAATLRAWLAATEQREGLT